MSQEIFNDLSLNELLKERRRIVREITEKEIIIFESAIYMRSLVKQTEREIQRGREIIEGTKQGGNQ